MKKDEEILYVEEEVGRVFCEEKCIVNFFAPDIERIEKSYFKRLAEDDLNAQQKDALNHLKWRTLKEPHEVWCEKTLTGDHRYTMISEYVHKGRPVWYVCICLCLKGEPSFLYIAFPTRNVAMVNLYRKGEIVQWKQNPRGAGDRAENTELIDGLAESWGAEDGYRAELSSKRKEDDIPPEDFKQYQGCMEETLEGPDEVWSVEAEKELKIYHFIRHYPDLDHGIWFLIVAKETEEDDEQIEIIEAFPTRDFGLVSLYRRGNQEIGSQTSVSNQKLVH